MSLTRGEIGGFLKAQKYAGKTKEEAIALFKKWLSEQDSATATDREKEMILDDIDGYSF